jgi:hypothetical protein
LFAEGWKEGGGKDERGRKIKRGYFTAPPIF